MEAIHSQKIHADGKGMRYKLMSDAFLWLSLVRPTATQTAHRAVMIFNIGDC
jgi:hypothetical protein